MTGRSGHIHWRPGSGSEQVRADSCVILESFANDIGAAVELLAIAHGGSTAATYTTAYAMWLLWLVDCNPCSTTAYADMNPTAEHDISTL